MMTEITKFQREKLSLLPLLYFSAYPHRHSTSLFSFNIQTWPTPRSCMCGWCDRGNLCRVTTSNTPSRVAKAIVGDPTAKICMVLSLNLCGQFSSSLVIVSVWSRLQWRQLGSRPPPSSSVSVCLKSPIQALNLDHNWVQLW